MRFNGSVSAATSSAQKAREVPTLDNDPLIRCDAVHCEEARGFLTPQLAVGANFRAGHILALFYAVQLDHVFVLRGFANGENAFGYCQRGLLKHIPG